MRNEEYHLGRMCKASNSPHRPGSSGELSTNAKYVKKTTGVPFVQRASKYATRDYVGSTYGEVSVFVSYVAEKIYILRTNMRTPMTCKCRGMYLKRH